jgi:hypothetical protein
MYQASPKILIGFGDFAGFLGVSIRRIFRHRQALRSVGAIEEHFYKGKIYSVALPDRLTKSWKARKFD